MGLRLDARAKFEIVEILRIALTEFKDVSELLGGLDFVANNNCELQLTEEYLTRKKD